MARDIPHVALLVETSRSYGRAILRGVRKYISENGPWSFYIELRALESKAPNWLRTWRGDGILTRTGSQAMADIIRRADVPTVELRASRLDHAFPFIGVDNLSMGRMIVDHLLERGFRRFALYAIDTEDYFVERCRNFVEAVNAAGCDCDVYGSKVHRERPRRWERQQDELAAWLAGLSKPVGVMACTDQLGFWLLDACKRARLAVPEEVAVVGVENDETLATMATPPLSSVQFDGERTGYEASRILDAMMRGEPAPLEPTLIRPLGIVTRQSSDVVAIEDKDVADAARFIREHAAKGITVDDVLRAVPVSRSALDRRMRDALGRTLKAEILRVQLVRVKQLLAETELPLMVIADKTGFRHHQYLAEVFKQRCGQTPGQYRAQYRLQPRPD